MDLPALFAQCRAEADFYRVQIDAENRLAPAEIVALAAQADQLPEMARAWLKKTGAMLRRAGEETQPFRRHPLAEHATFYEGTAGAKRMLVVGFCGIAMRMNLPAPAFLQALPAARCDVVILADPARAAFLGGVKGYAPSLPALVERLAKDAPATRYPGGIRCIGTSAGGAASLCFGLLAGARRAMSVDGAHPAAMMLRDVPDLDRHAFDKALAGRARSGTELICAHGATHERDTIRGRLLAAGLPGARSMAVAVEGGHGLLGPLLTRRLLARFFAEVLLSETEAAALPGTWPAAPP
jgi:hypothetical protein